MNPAVLGGHFLLRVRGVNSELREPSERPDAVRVPGALRASASFQHRPACKLAFQGTVETSRDRTKRLG